MNEMESAPASTDQPNAIVLSKDTPDHCEQLAVLASTGKSTEVIGVQLTHDQVLTDKEVEKYYKHYEYCVGTKTTETLIDSFLMLASNVIGTVLPKMSGSSKTKRTKRRLHHQQRAE